MKYEIKIPRMGESIVEAVISVFIKENGAYVQRDEEILEIETDKVNQVLHAPEAGVIQWSVALHETVKIGQVVGSVETGATAPVQEKQVKIQSIKEKLPVEATQEAKTRETRRPMSKIRQVIAERLVEAQKETAMLSTFNEVDMSAVMELRARNQENFFKKHEVKLGLMPFFVKATVAALQQFPSLNSYIQSDQIVHREYYDIGIAVSTDRGLVVPVLRNCDQRSFAEIEKQIAAYAKQAREGKLSVDDLQGGGFTITNGGVFGSLLSTPLLSPSQSGILGMHKIQYRPVAVNSSILIRPMMYLALSYDHRLVDGKEAISFLIAIKDLVEDPARLLLA